MPQIKASLTPSKHLPRRPRQGALIKATARWEFLPSPPYFFNRFLYQVPLPDPLSPKVLCDLGHVAEILTDHLIHSIFVPGYTAKLHFPASLAAELCPWDCVLADGMGGDMHHFRA